jgi:hypothetical protein
VEQPFSNFVLYIALCVKPQMIAKRQRAVDIDRFMHYTVYGWEQEYGIILPRKWMQHGCLKRWYSTTTLHGVTTQKDPTLIFTAVKTSHLDLSPSTEEL